MLVRIRFDYYCGNAMDIQHHVNILYRIIYLVIILQQDHY